MNRFLKTLGPGILFASTAIGVSHLVQSTRAGMRYGFAFLAIIVLINVLKYPFFEYGTRYAAATGTSLIDGYKKLGKGVLWVYFLITIVSLLFVSAAVFQVTAGFMDNLLQLKSLWDFKFFPLLLVVSSCFLILAIGRYKVLDNLIKIVGFTMFACTLIAFVLVLVNGSVAPAPDFKAPVFWSIGTVPFAIALMGWMPTAVDLSTWNSLWTLEKQKSSGYQSTVKEATREFAIGYWISAFLAICFLTLGAYLVYGTDTDLVNGSAGFANQVISLFTVAMGDWAYWIIAVASFCIMYGTSIGVLDGYARALQRTSELLLLDSKKENEYKNTYLLTLSITAIGGLSICIGFSGNTAGFLILVDIATILSFLIAPIIAVINYRLVTRDDFPENQRPNRLMRLISVVGIFVLSGLSVVYLWTLISA